MSTRCCEYYAFRTERACEECQEYYISWTEHTESQVGEFIPLWIKIAELDLQSIEDLCKENGICVEVDSPSLDPGKYEMVTLLAMKKLRIAFDEDQWTVYDIVYGIVTGLRDRKISSELVEVDLKAIPETLVGIFGPRNFGKAKLIDQFLKNKNVKN